MATLWEKSHTLLSFQKKNALPEHPGVYFFLDETKTLLYIGKATSLRDRVRSYFASDLMETRGPKIALMLPKVSYIAYRQTDSVLEALILESRLIKEHQPPYNTDAKDDKSYNHVVITDEPFPRVLIVRGRDIEQGKFDAKVKYMFGPFLSGLGLKEAMKIVRKLFPYRDKCEPFERTAKHPGQAKRDSGSRGNGRVPDRVRDTGVRPCFNRQIGLCPGVCTGEVSVREYGRTIQHIRLFFEGHKQKLVKGLEREMKAAAKAMEFERAAELRNTLYGLQHIQDIALIKEESRIENQESRIRIEAYDVAHLQGVASVGVVTVVEGSRPDKDEYRQFRLRGDHQGNDLTALREILTRRLGHTEWSLPDMIVVDGGELQRSVALSVLRQVHLTIPVLGVVKDERHQPKSFVGDQSLVKRFKKDILLANGEAHRFAIVFHRRRRGKEFLR